jgi:hypothetical protein
VHCRRSLRMSAADNSNLRGNAKKEKFFAGFPGGISSQSKPVADVAAALSKYQLGGIGFCWGYKVLVTSEGSGSFKALAGAHPS